MYVTPSEAAQIPPTTFPHLMVSGFMSIMNTTRVANLLLSMDAVYK